MSIILQSYAKINLTLRITSKNPKNGYHDLVSLFYKIPSGENVILEPDKDLTHDEIYSNIQLSGENTILKALRLSREFFPEKNIPYMRVNLFKTIPAGSGLGAGSGNAGAVINYLSAQYKINEADKLELAVKTGADVTFFCCDCQCACMFGIGDEFYPADISDLHGVILFPAWPAETQNAYKLVDEAYKNNYPLNELDAFKEVGDILKIFIKEQHIGLLPNDFSAILFPVHDEYKNIFSLLKKSGSYAFGVTGSGSAAFGLFHEPVKIELPEFINSVLYF